MPRQRVNENPASPRFGEVEIVPDLHEGVVRDMDPDEPIVFDDDEVSEEMGIAVQAPTRRLSKETSDYIRNQLLLTATQVDQLPEPDWFIDGVLPHAPLTVVHGTGGTKKSFVVLDWALHADQGIDWHGRKIRKGRTLYVVGEGLSGMGKRLRAWSNHHNVALKDLGIFFLGHPLDLFAFGKKDDDGEFIKAVEHWRALIEALHFDYLIIDTLHRNAPGADENSATDIGKVFSAADRVRGAAHVIFIHHDPKASNTARGSGSIHDDADVVVHVKKLDKYESRLTADKLRDAEDFAPIDLTFAKDHDSGSIYLNNAQSPQPKITVRQQIINAVRAEPGQLTAAELLCGLAAGDTSATRKVMKDMREEGILYSEVRGRKGNSGPKMVDYWFVNETKIDPNDEEFEFDDD